MSFSASFDDLIEADTHQALLESGNLNKRKPSPWTGENCWTSSGYFASVFRQHCASCGGVASQVLGIFHREKNGRGDTRDFRVTDKAQFSRLTWIESEARNIPHCEACLRKLFLS